MDCHTASCHRSVTSSQASCFTLVPGPCSGAQLNGIHPPLSRWHKGRTGRKSGSEQAAFIPPHSHTSQGCSCQAHLEARVYMRRPRTRGLAAETPHVLCVPSAIVPGSRTWAAHHRERHRQQEARSLCVQLGTGTFRTCGCMPGTQAMDTGAEGTHMCTPEAMCQAPNIPAAGPAPHAGRR